MLGSPKGNMETVRIRRKRKRGLRCPNNLFVLWLNEWANDAAAKGKKSQYVYQKALTSLKKYPLPLKNGAEAKILQNFGDSICKMLDRKLAEYFSKHGPEANIHYVDTPRGHRAKAVCDATKHKRSPRVKSITCSQPRRSRGEKPTKAGPSGSLPKKDVVDKKMKEYVPQKRSGGYALLITLYRSNQVGGEISLTKAELQNEAQALCDASLTVPEANSRYSAWSSMTTLIKKGLVRRSGKPARYSLTDQGAQLAERILKADQDLGLGEDSSRGLAGCCAAVAPTSTGIDNRVIDVIYIDDGENSGPSSPQRNNSRKRELVNELKRNGVAFDVRKLSVGDFLWVAKQRVRPVPGQLEVPSSLELVLDYVVERKRMDDLCGSIIDGRFREQKFRLKKCGLGNCIYLVEDHGSVQHMSIPETTLQQAIVNTQVVDGFVIKRTHDIRGSAAYLTIMTRHLQRRFSGKVLWSIPKQQKETLASQGVREDDGHFLLNFNEFNHESAKNKAQTVREVFARQLLQFQGLSGDKAAAILEKFPTPCSLIEAFEQCHSDEERANLLSSIKFGRLQRKLGPSLAKLIAGVYCATGPLT